MTTSTKNTNGSQKADAQSAGQGSKTTSQSSGAKEIGRLVEGTAPEHLKSRNGE